MLRALSYFKFCRLETQNTQRYFFDPNTIQAFIDREKLLIICNNNIIANQVYVFIPIQALKVSAIHSLDFYQSKISLLFN